MKAVRGSNVMRAAVAVLPVTTILIAFSQLVSSFVLPARRENEIHHERLLRHEQFIAWTSIS
jgi:hypothetical protein